MPLLAHSLSHRGGIFCTIALDGGGNSDGSGSGGGNRKQAALLVRPDAVAIDPIWAELADEAKRSHPGVVAELTSRRRGFGAAGGSGVVGDFLAVRQAMVADRVRRRRNSNDADIVESDEREIATEDKVVLIVSRSLNDRGGLPGHVYGRLVREHRERAAARRGARGGGESKETDEANHAVKDDDENDEAGREEFRRATRQDAHGVIRHITATLLEVRPGLGATPRLTEMTTTAVEGLVFGELYDSVFAEIVAETRDEDDGLMRKIGEFELAHQSKKRARGADGATEPGGGRRGGDYPISARGISVEALEALLLMPEARTPADKLAYCARFIEEISVHFSRLVDGGIIDAGDGRKAASMMGADSLLKMVCEHIIVAKVPRLNAELAFLEEFARDERLLGKEGYSLVTLQASLHFLNASGDFDMDIF